MTEQLALSQLPEAKAPIKPRKSLEPWIKDEVKYYDHQIEGIRLLANRTSFLLSDDMGLGKSVQALTVFGIDVFRGWCSTAIIVCPVSLKGNWSDECDKFTRFAHVTLSGTPKERQAQLDEFKLLPSPKVLIVNYEQVTAHLNELNAIGFDIRIFDEAHYLKNNKAKRTKACIDLFSRRTFLLTGTPILNHVNELWVPLHMIDPERFPKYWSFVNRYCVFGGFKDKQIIGVKNERELTAILADYQLRRLKKDVLDLPEVQIIQRRVDLLPEQRKLYDSVVQNMVIPNPEAGKDDDIENALTKFLRLKQICGTTYDFLGEDRSSKLDLAVEDAQELLDSGKHLVVFTQFRSVQTCYASRIRSMGNYPVHLLNGDVPAVERQGVVNAWAADRPGVIVCMLQVAGVGLNMVTAQHAQFLDKLFVPGLNRQAIDRLHRIGQSVTQPVQVLEYIARKTIENRVEQILRTKTKEHQLIETDPNWKRKLMAAIKEDEDGDQEV